MTDLGWTKDERPYEHVVADMDWTMEISLRTRIEIDGREVRDWLRDSRTGYPEGSDLWTSCDPDQELTGKVLKEFLRSDHDESWREWGDQNRDFRDVEHTELDSVRIVARHAFVPGSIPDWSDGHLGRTLEPEVLERYQRACGHRDEHGSHCLKRADNPIHGV